MKDDRVMLITGASTGIGRATAEQAAQAGFRLALAARSEDKLQQLAQSLDTEATAIRCDTREWDSQQAMVERVMAHYGQLDVVFANAGRGGTGGGFSAGEPDSWRDEVLSNVLGPALTLRASLAALKASRGHVLITGSVTGRRTNAGSFYGITKWAVAGMANNLREELRGTGIRVTLLEPGVTDTPFFDNPPNRALRSEDIARSVMFALAQPDSVGLHNMCVLPTPPLA